ncbi:MAG TPA: ABC transporter permease [Acidimicrobiales bacterium]|nr:ABC transporter permease [Acidimicrobiales bacterium]
MTAVAGMGPDEHGGAGDAEYADLAAARRGVGALMASLVWNPIVAREVRTRMRGWHTAALLTAYLVVTGAIGYFVYGDASANATDSLQAGTTGAELFRALGLAVMATIALVVPALVGPAVAGERERQTLELLLVTPLRPSRIIVGKLFAALAVVLFMVVASVPLFSIAFLLGGISMANLLVWLGFTVLSAISLGSLAVLSSVLFRRVSAATVVSYLALLVFTAGPLLGAYAWERTFDTPTQPGTVVGTVSPPITIAAYPRKFIATGPAGVYGPDQGIAYSLISAISPVNGAEAVIATSGLCPPGYASGFYGYGAPFISFSSVNLVSCASPGQDQTNLGPLGHWDTWQVTMALDAGVAVTAIVASASLLRRRELA